MSTLSRYAFVCSLLAACVPPNRGHQPQHRPQSSSRHYDQIGFQGNAKWWVCTAEGSLGTAYGDGPWSYSNEQANRNGPTRDEAAMKALEDCNAKMSFSSNRAIAAGQKREGGRCTISDCVGPGER